MSDSVDALKAEVERLRAALVAVQWGSCDGCGTREYCTLCRARFFKDIDDDGNEIPGEHEPTCIVGIALRTTSAQPEKP